MKLFYSLLGLIDHVSDEVADITMVLRIFDLNLLEGESLVKLAEREESINDLFVV